MFFGYRIFVVTDFNFIGAFRLLDSINSIIWCVCVFRFRSHIYGTIRRYEKLTITKSTKNCKVVTIVDVFVATIGRLCRCHYAAEW